MTYNENFCIGDAVAIKGYENYHLHINAIDEDECKFNECFGNGLIYQGTSAAPLSEIIPVPIDEDFLFANNFTKTTHSNESTDSNHNVTSYTKDFNNNVTVDISFSERTNKYTLYITKDDAENNNYNQISISNFQMHVHKLQQALRTIGHTDIANSLQVNYNNLKIVETTGDLLTSDADMLLHQTNCLGIMGGGIALQIRKKWPDEVFEPYAKLCNEHKNHPEDLLGTIQQCPIQNNQCIVNVFSQLGFSNQSVQTDYDALEKALMSLVDFINLNTNIKKVAFPKFFGCGIAGGDWNVVQPIIINTLKLCSNKITVEFWEFNK